ncbi:hypothetical protein [Acidovorax sp.]|uniref:hypothetical protein n=1 Tax=Acidovorax sp. TaxID=1872122 RepID=UPI003918CF34
MHRRLFAALILHFLLCVGLSAVGWNPAEPAPHGSETTAQGASHAPAAPGALSDADDHALLDDKNDLPEPLEPRPLASMGVTLPADATTPPVNRPLSVVVAPPHKPPRTSGRFA